MSDIPLMDQVIADNKRLRHKLDQAERERDEAERELAHANEHIEHLTYLLDSYDPDWERKEEAEQHRMDQVMNEGPEE